MKVRIFLFILFILFSTLPAFAQEDCSDQFKTELEHISGVEAVTQNKSGFLAILDNSNHKKTVTITSKINKLRKKRNGQCDFSGVAIAVIDNNFESIKNVSPKTLSNKDLAGLLYNYVYKLSPVQVEENLKGYQKLSELDPEEKYYKSRIEHYTNRSELLKTRAEYIARCLKDYPKDKDILDLKIKRDFYLFVVAGETPLKTAEKFMDKIAEEIPRPEKKMCVIAYNADLSNRETSCPDEYRPMLDSTEEELLMRHVQSLPGYKVLQNINGYAALKKLNPGSTLYTQKMDAYRAKEKGLQHFFNLRTVSGDKLISTNSNRAGTLYATINKQALEGKSESANHKLFRLLTDYYAVSGYAYKKCVLKNSGGETLGTITCNKSGCTFKK
ncbi:hypothetical protein [Maridesulfovibrio sp.]|uniref:hypothetical protein n=1 Tax=Maridesulfovibrio sp. TaxID=2795000 RepID=UPI0029F490A6|nr:hypothetical protein [Maridesulfovibrio sp.]